MSACLLITPFCTFFFYVFFYVFFQARVRSVAELKREEALKVVELHKENVKRIEQEKELEMKRAMAVKNYVKSTLTEGKEQRKKDLVNTIESCE